MDTTDYSQAIETEHAHLFPGSDGHLKDYAGKPLGEPTRLARTELVEITDAQGGKSYAFLPAGVPAGVPAGG